MSEQKVPAMDQETIDLVCDVLRESRGLRNALVRCQSVGWPVEVQEAFYAWQTALDKVIFVAPAGPEAETRRGGVWCDGCTAYTANVVRVDEYNDEIINCPVCGRTWIHP